MSKRKTEKEERYAQLLTKINALSSHFYKAPTGGFKDSLEEAIDRLQAMAEKLKREEVLRQAFQQYLPPRVVEKIITCPEEPKVEGERRNVTVLFADLSGFTALSEQLDAEEVMRIVNAYFSRMLDVVIKYGGTLDKFLGDALMVLFGAPVAHENDPERAVRAALEMLQAMQDVKIDQLVAQPLSLEMSIGINTGIVVAGEVGSKTRREYTVIGDTVNLAARIESVANRGEVLIGETTYEKVKHKFYCTALSPIKLKGKSEPVTIYKVIDVLKSQVVESEEQWIKSATLIGREAELQSLKACYEKVRMGCGQVVGIMGEAGVGKTRLMEEMIDQFCESDTVVLWGECASYGEFMSFLPFVKILKEFFEIRDSDDEKSIREKLNTQIGELNISSTEESAMLVDLLSPNLAAKGKRTLSPEQRKSRISQAIQTILFEISRQQPMILVFEDVHWIDPASLEVLGQMIQHISQVPILVCCLYRPEFEDRLPDEFFSQEIRLKKLSKRETATLIQSLLKTEAKVPPRIQQLIMTKSEGNPFYVEEVVKSFIELRIIEKKNGTWIFKQDLSDLHIPDTIQGVVMARIDRLDEGVRRTLQFASVLGRTFSLRLLQAICRETDDLTHHLSELANFDLVLKRRHVLEEEYVFKHIMTQEVAYSSLLIERREDLHQRVGRAIERLYADRINDFCDVLAHHYARSKDKQKAVFYLNKAGEKNYYLGERDTAWQQYQLSIELSEKLGDDTIKAESLRQLGNIERERNNWQMAREYYEKSLEIFQHLGDIKGVASIYCNIGIIYYEQANWPLAVEYYQKALEMAEQTDNVKLVADLHNNLGIVCSIQGDFDRAISYYKNSIAIYEKEGFKSGINRPYCNLAMTYVDLQKWQEADTYYSRALDISEELGDVSNMAFIYLNKVEIYLALSDLEKAIEYCNIARKIFKKLGDNLGIAEVYKFLGKAHTLKANWASAENYFRKSIKLNKKYNSSLGLAEAMHELGLMYAKNGKYKKAITRLKKARRLFTELNAKEDLKRIERDIAEIEEKMNSLIVSYNSQKCSLT